MVTGPDGAIFKATINSGATGYRNQKSYALYRHFRHHYRRLGATVDDYGAGVQTITPVQPDAVWHDKFRYGIL